MISKAYSDQLSENVFMKGLNAVQFESAQESIPTDRMIAVVMEPRMANRATWAASDAPSPPTPASYHSSSFVAAQWSLFRRATSQIAPVCPFHLLFAVTHFTCVSDASFPGRQRM
jgi:hypothetical protein